MPFSSLAPFLFPVAFLASCGLNDDQGNRPASASTASSQADNALLSNPARPATGSLARTYAGGGSFELPTADGWTREGDATFYHEAWDMTIVVQSELQDFSAMKSAYLDSYNETNVRDAPEWRRGPETIGTIAGVDAARTSGTFNNGTAYATQDYIFFDRAKTVILQGRVAETNKDKLAPLMDYIASTYRR